MKNEKGITLIALAITIIVMLILAGITTYGGMSTIQSSKVTKFRQELEIMQAQVDLLYEKHKDDWDTIGKDVSEADSNKVQKAFNAVKNAGDTSNYRYFDKETLEQLDIAGIEREYLVNILDRKVISLIPLEVDGTRFYTLDQITGKVRGGGLSRGGVGFTALSSENLGNGWTITLEDIEFSKYVGKGKVEYKLEEDTEWTMLERELTEDNYSFLLKDPGNYIIRVTDAAGMIGEVDVELEIIIPTITFAYSPTLDVWTNREVVTTVNVDVTGFTIETSTDGVNWIDSNSLTRSENGDVYARVMQGNKQLGDIAKGKVTNIDKIEPQITASVMMMEGGSNGSWGEITVSSSDNESGMVESPIYTCYLTGGEPGETNIYEHEEIFNGEASDGTIFFDIEMSTILRFEGEIEVVVKDIAGNEGKTTCSITVDSLGFDIEDPI